MKKIAFVLGYAGGILALVFSLLMIYTVPAGLISNTLEDIQYDMENENIIAFNEVAIAMQQQGVTADLNENNMMEFARGVAKDNDVISDENVYEDTVAFAYKTAIHGIISLVLVAASIVCGLVAFIGALVTRKAPMGGGIMMLIAALVLVLAAIYTTTVIPMIAAVAALAAAGIFALIPDQQKAEAHARRSRKKAQPKFAAPYPQPQFTVPYPQPQFAPPQYQAFGQPITQQNAQPLPPQFVQPQPATSAPAQADAGQVSSDLPFPEEEAQVFEPAGEGDNIIKE